MTITDPKLRKALRAGTLHRIRIDRGNHIGFSWAASADEAAEGVAWLQSHYPGATIFAEHVTSFDDDSAEVNRERASRAVQAPLAAYVGLSS